MGLSAAAARTPLSVELAFVKLYFLKQQKEKIGVQEYQLLVLGRILIIFGGSHLAGECLVPEGCDLWPVGG